VVLKYFSVVFLISLIVLQARENPFFPVDQTQNFPLTTNQFQKIKPLKRATMSLPSTARELESISVKYKNLDGSLSEKTIALHNSIDWHLPIFISQNYNLCGANSVQKMKNTQSKKYVSIFSLKFIRFYAKNKALKIVTKDTMLRNFLLVKPHRIVCDFKRDTSIRSLEKILKKVRYFQRIRVGTHDGYYRVVIELDGYYRYKVTKIAKGYLLYLI